MSVACELVSASVDVLCVVLDGATGPNRFGRSFKACPIPVPCEGERSDSVTSEEITQPSINN